MNCKKKVVVVGGGFGGLRVAQELKNADIEVILIDKTNHHLFQPLLYQVATAALSPADIARPLREILSLQENVTVFMEKVVDVDTACHHIVLSNQQKIYFDYLVLAVGARHSYFGHPEWEKVAPGLKTLSDATNIRENILSAYERAELCKHRDEAEKLLTFGIIGGGPTGVELAGAIAEIAHETMLKNFRRIAPEHTKIFLIEGSPQILAGYPLKLAQKAQQELEKLGVNVLTNRRVTGVSKDGIFIGNEFIEIQNLIWAAGNQASPLLQKLNVPLDPQGRVIVNLDLTIPGHDRIFVIGDSAHFQKNNMRALPAIAPVAMQQGTFVAKIIRHEIPKQERSEFTYIDKGHLATIGRIRAVGTYKNLQYSGIFAWVLWCFVHIFYLIGFRNRFSVMSQWVFWYFAGKRCAR